MIRYINTAFLFIILTGVLVYGCNTGKTDKESKQTADSASIRLSHTQSAGGMEYIDPKDLGTLVTSIDFQVEATAAERETFEDGIVPWISISDPAKEINRLVDADDPVISYDKVTLIIDYPVKAPVYFELTSTGKGFSRRQLITAISMKYHEMYKEEEETASDKTVPLSEREGVQNRNQTNGKYGIWGHDLSDLDLGNIEVYKNKNGLIYLSLSVES